MAASSYTDRRTLADIYRIRVQSRGRYDAEIRADAAAELTREILAREIVLPPGLLSSFLRLAPLSNDVLIIETKDGPIDADSVNAIYWNEQPIDEAAVPEPEPAPALPKKNRAPAKRERKPVKRPRWRSPIWPKLFEYFDPFVEKFGPFHTNYAAATAAFEYLGKTGVAFSTLERGIPKFRPQWVKPETTG